MRTAPIVALAMLAGLAARASEPVPVFADSPYLEPVPPHGACDVIVTPSNYTTTLAYLYVNDPSRRVFCVEPGDYRARGQLLLNASGTPESPRFLRFHADDGVANASHRSEQAIFEAIRVLGSWWVIQGLTVQPLAPTTGWFFSSYGGDHNLFDGNFGDGSQQWNTHANVGVMLAGFEGDPATHNTVQRNLLRHGNRSKLDADFTGVQVAAANNPGEDNDYNKVLDNEIVDWGDGVSVGRYTTDCSEPGVQHGTIVDGNDIYLTEAKRIDCDTGAANPNGECACAENGIDVKASPGPLAEHWTRLTRNRIWGHRPTSRTIACGGSGSNGQGITAGNTCAAWVLVAQNVVLDTTTGVNPGGHDWIIVGNLLHEIRAVTGFEHMSKGINASTAAQSLDIQFNTMVGVDTSYDDGAVDVDTRCNAVVDDVGMMGFGMPRGANHVTSLNFLYRASPLNFLGADNPQFATPEESAGGELCFWRKRWTAPERVCIPLAQPTAASPHVGAIGSCDPDLAAPFGMGSITYPTELVPEPARTAGALAALAGLAATRCRRGGASCRGAAPARAPRAARS
jgi:hypothetical protein